MGSGDGDSRTRVLCTYTGARGCTQAGVLPLRRVLAIDYGERRTGLAVSDELGITAQGLDTLVIKDGEDAAARVALVVEQYDADPIVIGLPRNMDGSESEKSLKVREFGARLGESTGRRILYLDERMTTLQAQRVMREMSVKTRGNKEQIDRIAATLILQDYLGTLR
ncbi:MAG: Holliday junction resolvase RuvX [Alphaproteobacteria bacterium]|nr:MAG: Holliday junction resolvase RuvX [Alphaproteobacteria bacterium]